MLKGVNAAAVVVDNRAELDGMTDEQIAVAAEAAKARKLEGKWVIALLNTTASRRSRSSRIARCASASTRVDRPRLGRRIRHDRR